MRRRPDPEPTQSARPGTKTVEAPERTGGLSCIPAPIPEDALTTRDAELLKCVEALLHDCYGNREQLPAKAGSFGLRLKAGLIGFEPI